MDPARVEAFQQSMLDPGRQAYDLDSKTHCDMSSLTLSVTREDFLAMAGELKGLRGRFLERARAGAVENSGQWIRNRHWTGLPSVQEKELEDSRPGMNRALGGTFSGLRPASIEVNMRRAGESPWTLWSATNYGPYIRTTTMGSGDPFQSAEDGGTPISQGAFLAKFGHGEAVFDAASRPMTRLAPER